MSGIEIAMFVTSAAAQIITKVGQMVETAKRNKEMTDEEYAKWLGHCENMWNTPAHQIDPDPELPEG